MTTSNQTTQATPNSPMLSEALGEQIARYGKASFGQDLELVKVITLFIDNGFKSTDLKSPKSKGSTATEELFTWVKTQTVAGFPKGAEALINMSGKAAGDKMIDGRNHSYWYRQPNSVVGAMSIQLKNQEVIDAEIASGVSKPNARTRSPEAIVKEGIGKVIAKMQKAETFDLGDMELDDAIQNLTLVLNAIR